MNHQTLKIDFCCAHPLPKLGSSVVVVVVDEDDDVLAVVVDMIFCRYCFSISVVDIVEAAIVASLSAIQV